LFKSYLFTARAEVNWACVVRYPFPNLAYPNCIMPLCASGLHPTVWI